MLLGRTLRRFVPLWPVTDSKAYVLCWRIKWRMMYMLMGKKEK